MALLPSIYSALVLPVATFFKNIVKSLYNPLTQNTKYPYIEEHKQLEDMQDKYVFKTLKFFQLHCGQIFNRSGVAGAVLQTRL